MKFSSRVGGTSVPRLTGIAVCVGLLFSLSANRAFGQATSTSSISGQVTDQQGAAVPGTEIKLIDPATKTAMTATANDAGRYIFLNIPSGTFAITFTKTGFSVFRIDGQVVEVGSVLTINAVLQVGATSTTVEVTASSG